MFDRTLIRCLLSTLTLAVVTGSAPAAPVMDGLRDAQYTLVADSPKDNLLVDASKGINDPADPRAKSLDVAGLWASNSRTDLYLYMELPYLDLNTIAGEWAVAFHLGGQNDALAMTANLDDPYGAPVDFTHAPALNAILKSNMRGFLADYDGNQGWAFLNPPNKAATDWSWENSNFLASAGWTNDLANHLIHGIGWGGGEVVYRGGQGIEVRVPYSLFAPNPSNTNLVAPKAGDTLHMQFYANVRERGTPRYPRGPIDCVPFEPASRTNPSRGAISQWGAYNLQETGTMEVRGAWLQNNQNPRGLVVSFSSSITAESAGIAANYTLTNEATGEVVPVASAARNPLQLNQALLDAPLPANASVRVTVRNLKSVSGLPVSDLLNTDVVPIGTHVVFDLRDPYGAISSLGNDPKTGQPYRVTVTGDMTAWKSAPDGTGEIAMNPVTGEPGRYRSAPVLLTPGVVGYKYRLPGLPDWDNWNALNPHNRHGVVPAAESVTVSDNAAGPVKNGGPVTVTMTLVDRDNVAAGRPVYVTGDIFGWSVVPGTARVMSPVPGNPNVYRVTFDLPAGYGGDTTTRYRYILKPDPTGDPGLTLWEDLNPRGDRWALFRGPAQSITDILGGEERSRILAAAGGLEPAPMSSGYFTDLDADRSGSVTLADARRLPRLKTHGTRIVDPGGSEVLLKGINLGGWFVEEMWMTPWIQAPPSGSPYAKVEDHVSLWSVLNQRLGTSRAANVRRAWRDAWIQPSDFHRIREAGFNHVRVPFLYDLVDEPGGMEWLRRAVSWANAAGLYVVLDMHGAPGGQSPWDHTGQVNVNQFFSSEANVLKAIQVWTSIAREFGGHPGVAAFNLLNEPAGAPDANVLHQVHNRLYQAIRAAAPDTMVVIEDGYKGVTTLPLPSAYGWTNVIYSLHFYNFDATAPEDHLNALNAQLPGVQQIRTSRNVPFYIGEFNLEPHNTPEALALYLRTLNTNGMSWAPWTYKTVARGGPMGFWGYVSKPSAANALNPFTDSETVLIEKMGQLRTENLTTPTGLAPVYRLP